MIWWANPRTEPHLSCFQDHLVGLVVKASPSGADFDSRSRSGDFSGSIES